VSPGGLFDEQVTVFGVDEAVEALDRALLDDSTMVSGPDTPARRALLDGGARTCGLCGQRSR